MKTFVLLATIFLFAFSLILACSGDDDASGQDDDIDDDIDDDATDDDQVDDDIIDDDDLDDDTGDDDIDDDDLDDDATENIPAPPINLSAQVVNAYRIVITWQDISDNEEGFNIYCSTDMRKDFILIGATGPDAEYFIDDTVQVNQSYNYAVTSFNTWGESEIEETAAASTYLDWEVLDAGVVNGYDFLPMGDYHFFYLYDDEFFEYDHGVVTLIDPPDSRISDLLYVLSHHGIYAFLNGVYEEGKVWKYNDGDWLEIYSGSTEIRGYPLVYDSSIFLRTGNAYPSVLRFYDGSVWDEWGDLGSQEFFSFAVSSNEVCLFDHEVDQYCCYKNGIKYTYDFPYSDSFWRKIGTNVYGLSFENHQKLCKYQSEIGFSTINIEGTNAPLWNFWGSSENDIFLIGAYGTILHYDGENFALQQTPTSEFLWTIWGAGENDVYVGGYNGTVLHYNGLAWSRMLIDSLEDVRLIEGTSSTNVYLLSDAWNGKAVYRMIPE